MNVNTNYNAYVDFYNKHKEEIQTTGTIKVDKNVKLNIDIQQIFNLMKSEGVNAVLTVVEQLRGQGVAVVGPSINLNKGTINIRIAHMNIELNMAENETGTVPDADKGNNENSNNTVSGPAQGNFGEETPTTGTDNNTGATVTPPANDDGKDTGATVTPPSTDSDNEVGTESKAPSVETEDDVKTDKTTEATTPDSSVNSTTTNNKPEVYVNKLMVQQDFSGILSSLGFSPFVQFDYEPLYEVIKAGDRTAFDNIVMELLNSVDYEKLFAEPRKIKPDGTYEKNAKDKFLDAYCTMLVKHVEPFKAYDASNGNEVPISGEIVSYYAQRAALTELSAKANCCKLMSHKLPSTNTYKRDWSLNEKLTRKAFEDIDYPFARNIETEVDRHSLAYANERRAAYGTNCCYDFEATGPIFDIICKKSFVNDLEISENYCNTNAEKYGVSTDTIKEMWETICSVLDTVDTSIVSYENKVSVSREDTAKYYNEIMDKLEKILPQNSTSVQNNNNSYNDEPMTEEEMNAKIDADLKARGEAGQNINIAWHDTSIRFPAYADPFDEGELSVNEAALVNLEDIESENFEEVFNTEVSKMFNIFNIELSDEIKDKLIEAVKNGDQESFDEIIANLLNSSENFLNCQKFEHYHLYDEYINPDADKALKNRKNFAIRYSSMLAKYFIELPEYQKKFNWQKRDSQATINSIAQYIFERKYEIVDAANFEYTEKEYEIINKLLEHFGYEHELSALLYLAGFAASNRNGHYDEDIVIGDLITTIERCQTVFKEQQIDSSALDEIAANNKILDLLFPFEKADLKARYGAFAHEEKMPGSTKLLEEFDKFLSILNDLLRKYDVDPENTADIEMFAQELTNIIKEQMPEAEHWIDVIPRHDIGLVL